MATRLSADGTVLDVPPLALARGKSPAVAFGSGQYLVAWSGGLPDGGSAISAHRLAATGPPLEPTPFIIREPLNSGYSTAVGWNGQSFSVAWDDDAFDIYAARVTPAATVLDSPPLGLAISGFWSDDTPRLGCRNGECLAIWSRLGTSWYTVWGALLPADGGFSTPQELVTMDLEIYGHDVTAINGAYLVAFSRGDTMGNYWGLAERVTS